MSSDACYEFDLNGYLILDDVVPRELLADLDPVLDRIQAEVGVGPAKPVAKLEAGIFRSPLLADLAMTPAVLERIVDLVVMPRLKSTWLDFKATGGSIGYHANHTPHNPVDAYHWQGRICASLVTVCYALVDVPEDGAALDVIPGSHKANFPLPGDPAVLARLRRKLPLRRGSALIFSHDMNHGSCNRRPDFVRRCFFTSFATGSSAHTQGDNDLYDDLHAAAPEGSWRKYLFRRPKGDRDSHPMPAHRPLDEVLVGQV